MSASCVLRDGGVSNTVLVQLHRGTTITATANGTAPLPQHCVKATTATSVKGGRVYPCRRAGDGGSRRHREQEPGGVGSAAQGHQQGGGAALQKGEEVLRRAERGAGEERARDGHLRVRAGPGGAGRDEGGGAQHGRGGSAGGELRAPGVQAELRAHDLARRRGRAGARQPRYLRGKRASESTHTQTERATPAPSMSRHALHLRTRSCWRVPSSATLWSCELYDPPRRLSTHKLAAYPVQTNGSSRRWFSRLALDAAASSDMCRFAEPRHPMADLASSRRTYPYTASYSLPSDSTAASPAHTGVPVARREDQRRDRAVRAAGQEGTVGGGPGDRRGRHVGVAAVRLGRGDVRGGVPRGR